jgi:type IV secretory pathway component VirB8
MWQIATPSVLTATGMVTMQVIANQSAENVQRRTEANIHAKNAPTRKSGRRSSASVEDASQKDVDKRQATSV